jgi:hypothetical protein
MHKLLLYPRAHTCALSKLQIPHPQVRALKLLKVNHGFRSVSGCMIESLVLWQQEQQEEHEQGERAQGASHVGASALVLLTRVLWLFGCENGRMSRRIWDMEDAATRQQPSMRMPRFVDQGDFIACANQAKRVLRVLGTLLAEVEAALQASLPLPPMQLADWKRRLERILSTSPDPVRRAVSASPYRGPVGSLLSTVQAYLSAQPSDSPLKKDCSFTLFELPELFGWVSVLVGAAANIFSKGSPKQGSPRAELDAISDDGSNEKEEEEGGDDLRRVVALLVGSAPAVPAPSSGPWRS